MLCKIQGVGKVGEGEDWVVKAVLEGEKLFLSINKEIRLKYSNSENHRNIFAVMVSVGSHNTSSSPSSYL